MDFKTRLNSIVQKDKSKNPKYIIEVIKSDLYYMLNNYFEVDFESIKIDITPDVDKFKIEICAHGDRMKLMKVLPE